MVNKEKQSSIAVNRCSPWFIMIGQPALNWILNSQIIMSCYYALLVTINHHKHSLSTTVSHSWTIINPVFTIANHYICAYHSWWTTTNHHSSIGICLCLYQPFQTTTNHKDPLETIISREPLPSSTFINVDQHSSTLIHQSIKHSINQAVNQAVNQSINQLNQSTNQH